MRGRVLLVVALVALAALSVAPAEAQVFLQNDGYVSGSILCYNGADQLFESVAAKFTATPAQYPYTIDQISVLACGLGGQDTYSFQIYNDNADTANPGTLIYSSPNLYPLTSGLFNTISMSAESPPPITSGTIRVAIYNQNTGFNPVGFGADLDGITTHRNFVSDTGGTWSFAENQGVTGDFILRLGIIPAAAQPALSIFDVAVTEGNAGTTQAVFALALSASSALQVTVDYATADGTATVGSDYASASGTFTFPPNITSGTLAVTVNGDLLDEPNETFFVNLTNPTNATIADNQATGTINDDDAPPALSIDDVAVSEGNTGTTNASFTVALSAPSGQPVSVSFATADGSATAPADYATAGGTVSFAAGETSKPVTVVVNGDFLDEADETFSVNLTSPTNATIADNQGVGTINDDDAPPALSIDDVAVSEGNTGTTNASFTVALSAPSGQPVSVSFATADGSATAPADYATASGTVSFAAGETASPVTVLVSGDLLDEPDETFVVNLTSPTNATIADDQGTGTINDDDAQPVLSVADTTAREGPNGTTTPATFAVTLGAPSGQTVTVAYATADGTANAGTDYQAAAGALTFTPGATSGAVSVTVNGDDFREPDETLLVNLTAPTNAGLADGQATGTIANDDAWPELTHGQALTANLAVQPGPTPDADFYRLSQKAYASYEVVVDGVSGDLGASGPALERIASDGVTVLQGSLPVAGGSSRSLRFENATASDVAGQTVRVRGTGCTITCGPEDVYRIRLYETTAAIPRFNNSGTQLTVVTLQNLTGDLVAGNVRLWDGGGALLATGPFSMPPHATFVLNTTTLPAAVGQSGSITVASDAPYGGLAGKSVAVEPATGFSFDSPLVFRPR